MKILGHFCKRQLQIQLKKLYIFNCFNFVFKGHSHQQRTYSFLIVHLFNSAYSSAPVEPYTLCTLYIVYFVQIMDLIMSYIVQIDTVLVLSAITSPLLCRTLRVLNNFSPLCISSFVRLSTLFTQHMYVQIDTPVYSTPVGPYVDGFIIPQHPHQLIHQYKPRNYHKKAFL